ALRRIDEDGILFRSHIDGALLRLTPEESMRIQGLIRADIAMVLDVCPPAEADQKTVEDAIRRTTASAKRCMGCPNDACQARFGIVQGGVFPKLRKLHLEEIAEMPFDGIALGGFSVGEPPEVMCELVNDLGPAMPKIRPRYLMGVGTPKDLVFSIGSG